LSFGLLEFGEFAHHVAFAAVETDAAGVADGNAERADDQVGALGVDLVAHYGVDGFHQGHLDGFLVFDEGHGMNARFRRRGDAVDHALVEVAKYLAAKSGRSTRVSSGLDVGAGFDGWIDWHRIQTSKII